MEAAWIDRGDQVIGEDISDQPEVKIIFDGYGDLDNEENYIEGGNENMESYAIFIHKDALKEGFVFPEHDVSPWCLIHRPKEEVCIYAWFDVESDEWEFLSLEDRIDADCKMNEKDVMKILEGLQAKYFNYDEKPWSYAEMEETGWPFPVKRP